MSAAEASGPGRRLSPEEETRGAQLFADGLSTRAVAAELGVGNGTAARLRQRLAARSGAPDGKPEETAVTEHEEHPAGSSMEAALAELDERLAALQPPRDKQADIVGGLEEREAVSRSAMAALDAEKLAALSEGRADVGLRERYRNACDDAEDWAKAAALAREKLAALDEGIAAIAGRRDLVLLISDWRSAHERHAELAAVTGARQRSAVLAVRDAAVEFVAAGAEEQAAAERAAELARAVAERAQRLGVPVSPLPPVQSTAVVAPHDAMSGPQLALGRAFHQARVPDIPAVAVLLGECNGWLPPLPPTPEEQSAADAAARELAAYRQAELERLQAGQRGEPVPPGWDGSVGLDANGQPLPQWQVAPHPRDAYMGTPAAVPLQGLHPGAR